MNHYLDHPSTVTFEPIAKETLGEFGRTSIKLIKDLAGEIKDANVRNWLLNILNRDWILQFSWEMLAVFWRNSLRGSLL